MPDWSRHIRAHIAGLRLAPAREAEIVEELCQHADDRYRELRNDGVADEQARRTVLDELTAHELLARELRGVECVNAPEPIAPGVRPRARFGAGLGQDLRYALRTLRKTPGFTAVAVMALALGIGANTAIFSVVNGVLLRPLSYPDSDRLLRIFETSTEFGELSVSYPNYLDWRSGSRSFVDMGTFRSDDFNFTGAGQPEKLSGEYVSASLFPTLGVAPLAGRTFQPEDDRPGAACTVVLAYHFWQRRFGGDRQVLGSNMNLGADSCAVIGIMPREFVFRGDPQIYVPVEQWRSAELRTREAHPGFSVVARLNPDATVAAAQSEIDAISAELASRYPATNAAHGARARSMKDDMVGAIRPTLLLLAGAVGFVLIIACANVANLLLARSTARKREFAIRTALGAERSRVVRQLLTESVLLSLGGAAIGLLIARWGTQLALAAAPGSLPRAEGIGIDLYVLLFTVLMAVATGILFGLAPAFHGANIDPQESLKEGTRGAGGGRHRTEGIFVAVEIGLAVVLLAGAGLMIQSVWRILQVDPGFHTNNLLTMQMALSPKAISNPVTVRSAYHDILTRVAAVPGVQAAAITTLVPLAGSDNEISYWQGTGPQPPQDKLPWAVFYVVTPDFPAALQLPLRHGRFFNEHDTATSPRVVLIDDVLAKRVFPGQDPIGRELSLMIIGRVEVIGVVGHAKHWGLDSDDTNKTRDQIYFPLVQVPDKFMQEIAAGLTLVMRTTPEPLSLVPAVRAQVAGPTQDQPVYEVRTMEQIISRSVAERRFSMLVLIAFAATALLLAAMGIYSVMSYAVTRRTQELGIRAALGASRREIVGLVLRQGMRPAAIGMGTGLLAAVALTRFMAGLLYGVRPADPVTLGTVVLLLGAIALAACYLPARRATRVDPVVALRCE